MYNGITIKNEKKGENGVNSMNISVVACLFVLDNEVNNNIKKNDIKSLKVVINKKTGDLIRVKFDEKSTLKELMRKEFKEVIGNDKVHLEQVYTFGESKFFDDKNIDVIYMGLANINDIRKLSDDYELINFDVQNNKEIIFGKNKYYYSTERRKKYGYVEYYHDIDIDDLFEEKLLLELITAFKHLRSRVDHTDVCFKLLPEIFTLEDIRIVYEMIKGINVDKSNFRKRIIKYCEKVDMVAGDKGYRPSQMYKFNPDSIEIWL